jgi:LDH2 family malate/lactate/ureidoglycolate dehydrogenase
MGEAARVGIDSLRACLLEIFARLDFPAEDAARMAEVLVESELRGYDDHGVYMLNFLLGWVRGGAVNPRARIEVVDETDSTLLLEADRACGVLGATRAMSWCVQRARERRGIALAGLRNSSHFVAAGIYSEMAAEAGLIGFACSNASPLVAPPGGRQRTLGTNPLAYAFPTGRGAPIVFDMATTAVAATSLYLAERDGRPAPPGTVRDEAGNPTDDPAAVRRGGSIGSLGGDVAGHKGFGLAMVVDILAGVMTGGSFARGTAQGGWGQSFWALDVEAFMPRAEFLARIDEQIAQIKDAGPRDGEEIVVPGERGRQRAVERRAAGVVPLTDPAREVLERTCADLGVEPPALQR